MKKILIILPLIVFSCILQGCRKHVYHTYYGDIDIDTMTAAFRTDGKDYYQVHYYVYKDTIRGSCPTTTYYCPEINMYENVSPDNNGQMMGEDYSLEEIKEIEETRKWFDSIEN